MEASRAGFSFPVAGFAARIALQELPAPRHGENVMTRMGSLLLVGSLLAACSAPVPAQEPDLRAVVDKAIKAHGGKETLAKFTASQVKYKGTVELNGTSTKVEGEIFHRYPD